MPSAAPRPVVLSVAGSDTGGGAGIQADLRTFSRLGAFGTTALTALTAQNLAGVSAVHGVPPEFVQAEIDAVLEGFPVAAAKTGMLWSEAIVALVAAVCRARRVPHWVVDPVMVATSGSRLLREEAITAYRAQLLPVATLVTPNLDEAAVLLDTSQPVRRDEMSEAAAELARRFGCAVLLKGGHLDGAPVDLLHAGGHTWAWTHPRVHHVNTHGSGCTLSAAITARLALGDELPAACEHGLAFVHEAMRRPWDIGRGVRLAGLESGTVECVELRRMDDRG